MIPEIIDSISISSKREKGIKSIVDWFDLHTQSFYTLGWFYLGNQHQLEELFYQSIIKVHKEWPRLKQDISFDFWVTSIFIQQCRELSLSKDTPDAVEGEPRPDFLRALDHLKDYEKEAILLVYIKGLSQEEAARILHIAMNQVKEFLFSGIRSLREQMGDGETFNGCNEYYKDYMDYLERTMERPKRVDFEVHIYHCEKCQEDLATFQEVRLSLLDYSDRMEDLQVPSQLMEKVKERLIEQEKYRDQKNQKRKRVGLVFASVFTLLMGIGIFTGAFSKLYYSWTEENEELRAYLQEGLGQRVNLEAKSDRVIVKIKAVIADDIQTLVYYEIEDTNENNQYFMNYDDGVTVENAYKIMNQENYPGYYPPDLESEVNKKEKNIYQGKMSLLPLKTDKGTIELKINRILKLIRDSSEADGYGMYGNPQYQTGEWKFKIPVTKQPSVEYVLKGHTKIEGIQVRFDKLIVAPTATTLQYSVNQEKPQKRVEFVNFKDLEVDNQIVKPNMYGNMSNIPQQDMNWFTSQAQFDSLLGKKPKEVSIQLDSAHLTYDDYKGIELDATQPYPQTFEYAGSTISIDQLEVGIPTKVVISNHEVENREYEGLQLNLVGEDENEPILSSMETEGVLVDRNGEEYDMNRTNPISYEEMEQPRHFETVYKITIDGNKVIPKRLDIYGYYSTKYLDDVVKMPLE